MLSSAVNWPEVFLLPPGWDASSIQVERFIGRGRGGGGGGGGRWKTREGAFLFLNFFRDPKAGS